MGALANTKCQRHGDVKGPAWCQDCHGIHKWWATEPEASLEPEAPRTFTPDDKDSYLLDAYERGLARSNAGRARRGKHRFGWEPTPEEQRHADGSSAASEALVSWTFDLPWESSGTVPDSDGVDVGKNISVRWTGRPKGSLIVHDEERDDLFGFLVLGTFPSQSVRGWIKLEDGKRSVYWRANVRNPAFFVPQSQLAEPSYFKREWSL